MSVSDFLGSNPPIPVSTVSTLFALTMVLHVGFIRLFVCLEGFWASLWGGISRLKEQPCWLYTLLLYTITPKKVLTIFYVSYPRVIPELFSKFFKIHI